MAIESEKIWKIFRRGGLWLALSSVGGAIVFGVVNQLSQGIIPSISDGIRDRWSPPKYLIIFSSLVDLDVPNTKIEPLPKEDARKITIEEVTSRYISLSGPPGEYWVTLTRKDSKFLPARLALKRAENLSIDTAEEKWGKPEVLSKSVAEVQSREPSKPGSAILRTRWVTTPSDYDQIALAKSKATKTILSTGLNEVGVGPPSDPAGKTRIYNYWSVIPTLREMNRITVDYLGPWGGAFLAWVITKSQVDPPNLAAAYNSWAAWGQSVPTADPEPGAVALFETKAVPGLTGNYLAGIVLRRLPECTEVITGNIFDRVVIACVVLPIATLRKP
ncbi:hypothetical protein [Bradyrhizobium sp. LA7.1]|uniref:hypothetical protein n=1 Tax=Bradyrhizobium sp. LA7.1 TaxID=3156324 RepID=UPI003395E977